MRLNGLVTNIRALGEQIEEAYVVKKILRAVPTKFLQIVSAIEQFGNLEIMSVEETVGSLKAHEERMRGQKESSEYQLLLTEEEWVKRERKDGQLLFTREEWLKWANKGGSESSSEQRGREFGRGYRDRSKVRCYNCGVYGHFQAECRKAQQDKEQKNEANLTQDECDEPTLLLAKCDDSKAKMILLNEEGMTPKLSATGKRNWSETSIWYLDNGASNHMTGLRSMFNDLDETVTRKVRFGDGSILQIEEKGSVMFRTKDGKKCKLRDVYFIPNLYNNILSLGQLSESGSKVLIKGEYLWIYDENDCLIMKVNKSTNRLYKLVVKDDRDACFLTKSDETTWLWHTRLGHVNFQSMLLMSRNKMVRGLPDFTQPKEICDGCLMAKQTRHPFPAQREFTAKQQSELIHGDICGPITP